MTTATRNNSLFAIVVNGAVWGCRSTAAKAIEDARLLASYPSYQRRSYQGFDDQNRSAVVERPVTIRIEGETWDVDGWAVTTVVATWVGGVRQEVSR